MRFQELVRGQRVREAEELFNFGYLQSGADTPEKEHSNLRTPAIGWRRR
jgi:hypothetical protein